MINLFEKYTEKEKDLEDSLRKSGYYHQTIVINDDGYLPKHVLSPISFFCGSQIVEGKNPKFFNDLILPAYWEIKGDNQKSEIFDGYKKKGNIKYSSRPGDYRNIKAVEWLNDEERTRAIDLYNQNGDFFGRKVYSDGELTLTTYFDSEKKEVILHNHNSDIIQLNYQEKQFIFHSYIDFILFFFKETKIDTNKIIYNSLGLPLFISDSLKSKQPEHDYCHFLFWQEKSEEIPGNMKYLINSENLATKKIIVQNREEFIKIKEHVPKSSKLEVLYLGFIYDFKNDAHFEKKALILTQTDQIYHLKELADLLPDIEFNIAAYTEMSPFLLEHNNKPNVKLYPTVSEIELENLLMTNGIYLDINAMNEVDGILRRAFDHNLLGFGFFETNHETNYMMSSNRFKKSEYYHMVSLIRAFTKNLNIYQDAIEEQQQFAGQTTVQEYKDILK